ncbi:MAG: sigma-70 region 4 domain-containing protein [Nitrososphaera sp.]|nr:sigma-70 region 4 domain-containing protein [Nitrososphaera sp.]
MALTVRKLATSKEQVLLAYENGATMRQIADVHGVSVGTVRNLLIAEGVTIRAKGRQPKNGDGTRSLAVDDLPTEEV